MKGEDDRVVIRPQRWTLALTAAAFWALGGVAATAVVREHDMTTAWAAVLVALCLLPVVDWCRQSVVIDADGLSWQAFCATARIAFADVAAYGEREDRGRRSGIGGSLCIQARDGARIDVSLAACRKEDAALLRRVLAQRAPLAQRVVPAKARSGRSVRLMFLLALALTSLAALVLYELYPWTLLAQRLFSVSAALGLAAGLALGAATGRALVPHRPIVVMAGAALCLTLGVPGAAFFANGRFAARRGHTVEVRVVARALQAGREGSASYALALDVGGIPKRIVATRKQWMTLAARDRFPACVRNGAFGSPIIVRLGNRC